MLKDKLQDYIDQLSKDIDRLRITKSYSINQNQQNLSDANLLEDIKNDLEQLMKGVR